MRADALKPPPSTILVVDDTPTNLQLLVRTLEGSGHRILAAKDGPAAIDIATRAKPDLMLLDVMMPGMDGFAVCRAIKEKPETRDTLVIFLSARGDVADKVSGLELGAIDYITKPIQAEEVLARVAVHLSRQHLERELRRSRDRLDQELKGAAQMQQQLLPSQMPSHPSISFGSFYQTSRHAGGDYYDVLPLYRDRIGILVADVSGHGAPAAIVMAMIRAVMHSYPDVPDDPVKVLRYINSHFKFLWETPMYATAIYAVIDPAKRTMRIASAGHPLPLRVGRDGDVQPLELDTTMCLLWQELDDVPCLDVALQKGDRWVFFTDGITDRESTDGTMFDLDRLSAALAHHRDRTPAEIVTSIVGELDTFSRGQEPEDDQTLLVVGINSASP
jgi:sigma-B regulation protein RsbU (phosphoserine phosphatase)